MGQVVASTICARTSRYKCKAMAKISLQKFPVQDRAAAGMKQNRW